MSDTKRVELSDFVLEQMPLMSGGELKIVLAVGIREPGRISLSQFEEVTGLSRNSVKRSVKTALEKGWIERKKDGNSYRYCLGMPPPNGAKMAPKMEPKWPQKWSQNGHRTDVLAGRNGAKMAPKMEPKWPQNGCSGGAPDYIDPRSTIDDRSGVVDLQYNNNNNNNNRSSDQDPKIGGEEVARKPAENPEDPAAKEIREAISLYENNIGPFGPILRDNFNDLLDTYGPQEMKTAIHLAVNQNVRKLVYIQRILENRASGSSPPSQGQRNGSYVNPGDSEEVRRAFEKLERPEIEFLV